MRTITREIVSAIIISQDGKYVMGQKDPQGGSTYRDCWHIPGGGIEVGESFEEAVIREVEEETGLILHPEQLIKIAGVGHGASEKTLKDTGEVVLCEMTFNRFEVRLSEPSTAVPLVPGDDFMQVAWIGRSELSVIKQIPGGKEFFQAQGYLD